MIKAHTHRREAKCPTCDTDSARVHSYYQRTPRDLPVSECRVHLQLTTKRFRCLNTRCPQQIFTERLPDLLAPYARCTQRLIQACYHVGQALGGEAAARLLDRLRMPISGDTVLRLLQTSGVSFSFHQVRHSPTKSQMVCWVICGIMTSR